MNDVRPRKKSDDDVKVGLSSLSPVASEDLKRGMLDNSPLVKSNSVEGWNYLGVVGKSNLECYLKEKNIGLSDFVVVSPSLTDLDDFKDLFVVSDELV